MKYLFIFTVFITVVFAQLPTLTMDYSQMPEVICNMYNAIQSGRPSTLTRASFAPNTITKTINGNPTTTCRNAAQTSHDNRNRRDSGCVNLKCPPIDGIKYNCDEYPFASTYNGGVGARIICVPQKENSLQGYNIKSFYAKYNIPNSGTFVVDVSSITQTECPNVN